jgi:hypothetical protein
VNFIDFAANQHCHTFSPVSSTKTIDGLLPAPGYITSKRQTLPAATANNGQ